MTSFIEAAAEREPSGVRGEMKRTGRAPQAQQLVGPPRWKLAALSWFGIFPTVTAILALAEPWLDQLLLVARTFALTAVLVPAMVLVVMPASPGRSDPGCSVSALGERQRALRHAPHTCGKLSSFRQAMTVDDENQLEQFAAMTPPPQP